MDGEMISVINAAKELGKHKQSVFKKLKRLGITPQKRRDASRGNQLVGYITNDEFGRVKMAFSGGRSSDNTTATPSTSDGGFISQDVGVFYLLQLEPEHDPTRFKVGFASNLLDCLRTLRCSAPFIEVVKKWPCKALWEKTAIDCVTADCEQLHTEIFHSDSLESVVAKCEHFFEQMPKVD